MESLQGHASIFIFLHLFLSLSLLPSPSTCQLITGGRLGNKSCIFHFGGHRWWPAVLMRGTCEPHAVRLWKGLTLPFDSTSAPHKTGKATVRLVDYPSHSQMPSNDYLATSKVQWQGPPPGSTVQSQWRPDKRNWVWFDKSILIHKPYSFYEMQWVGLQVNSSDSCCLVLILSNRSRLILRQSCRWNGEMRLRWDFKWKAVYRCQRRKCTRNVPVQVLTNLARSMRDWA